MLNRESFARMGRNNFGQDLLKGLSSGELSRNVTTASQNKSAQSGLSNLQQQLAASGNAALYPQMAAGFLSQQEQARRQSLVQERNMRIQQLLQALGLQTDLAAKLAEAQSLSQFAPGIQGYMSNL